MNVFINRTSSVPLQEQLCAQVGQLVACGALAPGQRLPSIRALAQRLQIHHNTVMASYKTLAARGVLVIKEGSGVRVADYAPSADGWREGVALRAMAAYFVAQARARGHDEDAIEAAYREALRPSFATRLVVVNPHPDLQRLYMSELARDLDVPMQGMTLEEVAEAGPEALTDTCFVTSTNHVAKLQALLGEAQRPVVFRLASTEALFAQARQLPADGVIGIVSDSPRFLVLTKELLSGVCDEAQLVCASLDEADQVRSALRSAALVVTDSASHAQVAPQCRSPLYLYRLLAEDVLPLLAERLPSEALRPAPRL